MAQNSLRLRPLMLRRRSAMVAAIALATVLVGCTAIPSASTAATPRSLPVTELTKEGFLFGAKQPALLAAPSLTDLLGLLRGVGVSPNLDECNRLAYLRAQCWMDIKDPGNSLMVAAFIDVPCAVTNSVTAVLSSTSEVTITVINGGSCVSGGTQPLPFLSLLAIPLSSLPADEVTINLVHPKLAVPTAKTMVDLRRPLNTSTDLQARITEVLGAITAATNDAVNRVPPGQSVSFLAIWTNRWKDTGLGCAAQGQPVTAANAAGYAVFLRGSDKPQSAMEYHASGASLAFCGQVSNWASKS